MRKLLAIGVVGAAVGYAVVYFALGTKPAPAPEPRPEQAAAPAEAAPPRPVVLANVVEVTDIDHLLDPAPAQPTGEPFDPAGPTAPVNALPAAPIPPAGD
jgi:hypothetical protein